MEIQRRLGVSSARTGPPIPPSGQNRSRSAGIIGHVVPESPVTFDRKSRSRCSGIVGHDRPESSVTLVRNTQQWRLEALVRVEAGKKDGLIADQTGAAVDRVRVTPLDLEIRLAAGHEEAARLVEAVQPLEVEKAPIHDVERAGLGQQLIEDVDLVHLAVADMDEGRDVAAQVEQRVQLDRLLVRAKRRPREYRQAQIDGGRI